MPNAIHRTSLSLRSKFLLVAHIGGLRQKQSKPCATGDAKVLLLELLDEIQLFASGGNAGRCEKLPIELIEILGKFPRSRWTLFLKFRDP
jgi:hypothetical protein